MFFAYIFLFFAFLLCSLNSYKIAYALSLLSFIVSLGIFFYYSRDALGLNL
jgi:hypothetical protein